MINQKSIGFNEGIKLAQQIVNKYKQHRNKQLMRAYYCANFGQSERTFYRKIKSKNFTANELLFLKEIMIRNK